MTPARDPRSPEATITPLSKASSAARAGATENAGDKRQGSIEARAPRRRSSESTRTWREGSRTARRWNTELIGWTALIVGAGVIASIALSLLMPGLAGSVLSGVVLWVAMAVPVALAFRRSRPRGLLQFRWRDLLYGVALGGVLRVVQGWTAVAAGDSGALPSYPLIDGQLPGLWWLSALVGPVLLSPVIEEFLFRGVVLIAVYRIARRGLEGTLLAIVASTAAFVAMHIMSEGLSSWEQPVTLALVGATCATLVLLTGRIWGAVLLHVMFNISGVMLTLVGTALA